MRPAPVDLITSKLGLGGIMSGPAPIPEDRPLSAHETALVRWMLEHGTAVSAEFLPQLAEAPVVSRCYCGCAPGGFALSGVVPPPRAGVGTFGGFPYRPRDGDLCRAVLV